MTHSTLVFFKDKAGGYRWHMKAPNGNKIGCSGEAYRSKQSRIKGFRAMCKAVLNHKLVEND